MLDPGVLVIVHDPEAGSPVRATVPVVVVHVGCVMVPTTGAEGLAFTVNGRVLLQPSAVLVYVNVTAPAAIAFTTPAFVTVAIEELLLSQVPCVDGVTFAVPPIHTVTEPPKTGAPGIGLMATFAEDGEVHELLLVTVKV